MSSALKFCVTLATLLMLVDPALAQGTSKDMLAKLGYAELQVTPLASERLKSEAKYESQSSWATHLPLVISSGLLLAASSSADAESGLSTEDQADHDDAVELATAVSGAWLLTAGYLTFFYKPYKKGYRKIKKMPAKTKRQRLAKERAAEEALYAPAEKAWMLQWFPFVTNLAASLLLNDANLDDDSKLLPTVSAVAAAAPILFRYRWQKTRAQHKEYKKKIFGPVASTGLSIDRNSKRLIPTAQLSWSF